MITDNPKNEFWYNVSNQNEIPIFGTVDKGIDISKLEEMTAGLPENANQHYEYLKKTILKDPDTIDILRTLVGVSDKRMYLELSFAFAKFRRIDNNDLNVLGYSMYDVNRHPLDYFKKLLSGNSPLKTTYVEIICKYLEAKGLMDVLFVLKDLTTEQIDLLVEKWIITKEVQQAEAKQRGHGAEFEVAKVFDKLGCKMLPASRHENAMAEKDPNVDKQTFEIREKEKGKTFSFDLIVLDKNKNPVAFVQSFIHTSDPGQYGVNKSNETVEIKEHLDQHNESNKSRKQLWGIVDGVGFSENKKDTIDKMLDLFDCFIQLKTLYKVGLELHKLGIVKIRAIRFDSNFYDKEQIKALFNKYGANDIILVKDEKDVVGLNAIEAGKAILYI
jgi:hypothetical protein